jgi:hypothetical protein
LVSRSTSDPGRKLQTETAGGDTGRFLLSADGAGRLPRRGAKVALSMINDDKND